MKKARLRIMLLIILVLIMGLLSYKIIYRKAADEIPKRATLVFDDISDIRSVLYEI